MRVCSKKTSSLRLMAAICAAIASISASAAVFVQAGFEADMDGFVAEDSSQDASERLAYGEDEPSATAPYPFSAALSPFGEQYLSIDSGETMLWRSIGTRTTSVYMDMFAQFNTSAGVPEVPEDSKVAVYIDANSNVVVVAGTSAEVTNRVDYLTTTRVNAGEWGRMTVNAIRDGSALSFQVRINGALVETAGGTSTFPCLSSDTTITSVGFGGTGALDDFVARTSDPYGTAASINGETYATLEQALEESNGATITLLADHPEAISGMALNTSYAIAANGHSFGGFVGADGVIVTATPGENGVVTYAGEGVANCNGTWYATFAEAYEAARVSASYPSFIVKVDSDFTPPISTTINDFSSIKFESLTGDPVTINLKNSAGTAYMAGTRYYFPDNATLVLAANLSLYDDGLISGGSLEVPEDVTVTFTGQYRLRDVGRVVGAGTVVAPTDSSWFINSAGTSDNHSLFTNELWTGTLCLRGTCTSANRPGGLAYFGNSGSSIAFDGFTCYAHIIGGVTSYKSINLTGSGLTINGDYATRAVSLAAELKGSGPLVVNVLNSSSGAQTLKSIQFTGGVSNFVGSVSFGDSANSCVVFGSGSKTITTAKYIEVLSGAKATVGASATWASDCMQVGGELSVLGVVTNTAIPTLSASSTVAVGESGVWYAPDFLTHGNLTLDGVLRDTDGTAGVIWSNTGTAVVRANRSDACKLGNDYSWRGRFIIGWNPSNGALDINKYGSHADATIVFDGTWPSGGYIGTGDAGAYTVNAKLVLDSAIAIGNGFGGSANRVTYNKISGSANFATWQYGYASDEVKGYVTVNTLDEYHGSIQVRGGSQLTIGTVNVSGSTDLTGCIVPVSCTTPFNNLIVGSVNGYPSLSVDGSDTGKNLVYATKNATTGLYLAVAEVNGVKYATLAEAAANAGASSSITKLADTAEAVPAGWKLNGSGTAYVKMHSVRFTVY